MFTFLQKYKIALLVVTLSAGLLMLFIFTVTISSVMAAAASMNSTEATAIEGAMGTGLPEFLKYSDIEYCVYISNEEGIPASILLGQIILNQEKIEQTYDVFLVGKTYISLERAIKDYSEILSSGKYAHLKTLNDKYDWATALYDEGIVNDRGYPDRLRTTIDSYNLGRFDGITVEGLEKAMAEGSGIANGNFVWPLSVKGVLTSPFGGRLHPVYGYVRNHTGQDIAANQGTAILAADGGLVEFSGWINNDGGYTVIINHGSNLKTMYCHIMEGGLLVTKGQKVSQGQQIARVGSTGASTGPHLHFSVLVGSSYVDPMDYVVQPY